MGDEWIKYTVCSELGVVEDSAQCLRAGCPGQDMHLTQRLVSACPRVFVHVSTDVEQAWAECVHTCSSYV